MCVAWKADKEHEKRICKTEKKKKKKKQKFKERWLARDKKENMRGKMRRKEKEKREWCLKRNQGEYLKNSGKYE